MEYWRDDTLFFYFAAFVVLIVCTGNTNGCVFRGNSYEAARLTEDGKKVNQGPTYLGHVPEMRMNPVLDFAHDQLDFGACFVYKAGMPTNTKSLVMENKGDEKISVECLQSSNSHLDVNFGAVVLPPGGTATATFTFYPRETVAYRDVITFLINGFSKRDVTITGAGIEMRVELVVPHQRLVRFGALRQGQLVKHVVPIINRSPVPISLTLSVTPVSQALQDDPSALKLMPSDTFTLEGKGGTKAVEVYFSPKTRIPVFIEEIMMECAGMSQPLFIVTGSCQDTQIILDQDSIPFGAVVQGSTSKKHAIMQNNGDVETGLCRKAAAFKSDFSTSPVEVNQGPTNLGHVPEMRMNPVLDFAHDQLDFGACFVYKAGMPTNTKSLVMENKGDEKISVECLQSSNSHLDVNFGAVVLPPGGTATATFTFYPRETVAYRDVITFLINGFSKRDVTITGAGIEMRVELVVPHQLLVRFGALRQGQLVKHVVPIINRSPVPISLTLSVTPVSQALQDDPSALKLMPSDTFTLEGKGGTKAVEVYFFPETRIPVFIEEIMMECAGMSQPLFIVTGSCQDTQISLDQDSNPFGAVVQGSTSKKHAIVRNNGDNEIGLCRKAAAFKPDFSTSPVEGSVLFLLPDGIGLLSNLLVQVDPPKPDSRVSREVSYETACVDPLPINNWLRRPQKYKDGRYLQNMRKTRTINTPPAIGYVSFSYRRDSHASTILLDPPKETQVLKLYDSKGDLKAKALCTAAAGGQRDEEVATGATNFAGISVEALNEENKKMKQPILNLIKRLYKKLTEWEKIDLENFVLSRREQRMKRYKDGRYLRNMRKTRTINTPPAIGCISFSFQNDNHASTILLDPPKETSVLKLYNSKQLSIWASPKISDRLMDTTMTTMCCVRENPKPIRFNVARYGVRRPEIALNRKQLHSEKVLLNRKDSSSLYLRSNTMLPVSWHVVGMEAVRKDFSLKQRGVIESRRERALQRSFRASKTAYIQKVIRLETTVDGIPSHVARKRSLFSEIREESDLPRTTANQPTVWNKNGHSLLVHQQLLINLCETLPFVLKHERTFPGKMQVIFQSHAEVTIRDFPVPKCPVIEPSIVDGNAVVASIPIRLSVRSVLIGYVILPKSDISFGPIIHNTKNPRTFTIKNRRELDFKETCMIKCQPLRIGEDTGTVLLASIDLVLSTYDVVSSPAEPQKNACFETSLGNIRVVKIKFQSYVRQKTDYICKQLSIWANPKISDRLMDTTMTTMCCVRENPKPIRFNVARYGVRRPEIALDRKQLHSEKTAVDGIPSNVARKRSLFLEICAEGNLPRTTANQPTVWNKNGHTLLVHQQLLINDCETLPFVLKHERAFPSKMQVIFQSHAEVTIRDFPVPKCPVIGPSIVDGKAVVASVPIRLSVRSVLIDNVILPKSDISFGPMIRNTKKSRTFTTKNRRELNLKETCMIKCQPLRIGEDTGTVLLASIDLVLSTYDVVSSPAEPQKNACFETSLGNIRVVKIKFQSYVRQKTDYICKQLSIWANPKISDRLMDTTMTTMCCVRENPKPIRFNVARYGVRRPEIALDRKQLHSKKTTVDGIPSNVARKRSLFLEICAEGNLPRITANQPTVWNKNGHTLLVHQQLLINDFETLPFVLKHERAFSSKMQVIFQSHAEVTIRDFPEPNSPVIGPSIVDGKAVVASIPIRLSVRSVLSDNVILPKADISFGPIIRNTKNPRTFTIKHNKKLDLKETCMFEYQPLRVGEDTGKVLLASNDLVLSTYDLVSSTTGPQKHFFFETNLGNSRVVKITFQNYVRQKSDYIYKETCMFEHQPLRVREETGKHLLASNGFGLYTYVLVVRWSPAVREKTCFCETNLGNNQMVKIDFQNYARQETHNFCKIDNSEWSCQKSVTAAYASSESITEVTVDVIWKPIRFGAGRAAMILTSAVGEGYAFSLHGFCDPPKPIL